MRSGRVGQLVHLVDVDLDRPGVEQAGDRGEHIAVGDVLVARGAHTRGPRRLGVARPRSGRHEHVQSAGAQHLQRPGAGVVRGVADEVDHDVDLGEDVFEAGRAVVDHLGRAEFAQPLRVAGRRRRRHPCAEVRGQLHGEVADSAGAGMDEDALPLVRVRRLDHEPPRGERRERYGRGFGVRQRGGLAREREGRHDRVLGVRATRAREGDGAEHLGVGREGVRLERRRDHDPAEVEAERRGQGRHGARDTRAGAGLRVDGVDAGGDDPHEHLAEHGARHRHVGDMQNVGGAGLVEDDGTHGRWSGESTRRDGCRGVRGAQRPESQGRSFPRVCHRRQHTALGAFSQARQCLIGVTAVLPGGEGALGPSWVRHRASRPPVRHAPGAARPAGLRPRGPRPRRGRAAVRSASRSTRAASR